MQLRQIFAKLSTEQVESFKEHIFLAREILAGKMEQKTEIDRMIASEEYRQLCFLDHSAFLELKERELGKGVQL